MYSKPIAPTPHGVACCQAPHPNMGPKAQTPPKLLLEKLGGCAPPPQIELRRRGVTRTRPIKHQQGPPGVETTLQGGEPGAHHLMDPDTRADRLSHDVRAQDRGGEPTLTGQAPPQTVQCRSTLHQIVGGGRTTPPSSHPASYQWVRARHPAPNPSGGWPQPTPTPICARCEPGRTYSPVGGAQLTERGLRER